MPSYTVRWIASVAIGATLAGLAVIKVADPTAFGLTVVQQNWLVVVMAVLGFVAAALPPMGQTPDAHRKSHARPPSKADTGG